MALPGTGAAQAGSLSGARRNSCPGGGEAPARERSPDVVWQGARVALRVLGAAGPGLPRDAALSVCLAPPPPPAAGSPSGAASGRCALPSAPACVASASPASAWLPGLIVLGGIKVGN